MTEQQPQEFAQWLYDLDDGRVQAQLTTELPELVRRVMSTGKKGKLSLTLDVKRENDVVVIAASVKSTQPHAGSLPSMFFVDNEGYLYRDNPRQLPLVKLDKPESKPIRVIKE
ncbi:MAG: hypothetical protein V2A73_00400 [Pseudomonadota bacterium]